MTFLVDVNVLVDVALNRQPWAVDAKTLFDEAAVRQMTVYVSAAAVPTLFYLTEKFRDTAAAFAAVDLVLAATEIVEVSRATLVEARGMAGVDFEDNLQIACAVAAGADSIVTRDQSGFTRSPIPAMSAIQMLALITQPP